MRVLAVDTALAACSAALWQDGQVLARRMEVMPRGQSEALMPMVAAMMAEAGVPFGTLDRLAVTVGPGSFTGIRIGLAAARGMALAADIPVIGVTTLAAVAHGVDPRARAGRTLLVALDAGRPDLFVQAFAADLSELGPVSAAPPAGVAALLPEGPATVAGNGAARVREALAGGGTKGKATDLRFAAGPGLPDAAHVAAVAALSEPAPAGRRPPAPSPLYIHPPYAKLPKRMGRR
jgi:tRNA threonylcarbamoyladenosine biosynthesis protein TsaB